ncbi:phage tail tip lysozyme [[Clostridium] innocuum]|nr:phage tail tip lysozyme [[Clostridium] innocuum]
MSKETRKDVNKTFRSGEFATSKGLRWTGKGLDKSAKFVSEWKYNRQESKENSSDGNGGRKDTLGIQTQVDKPNTENQNTVSQGNDNSSTKTTDSFSESKRDIPINSRNEHEDSVVLGIKTMESSNNVSVNNAVTGDNDKNSAISNIKTLANTGDGKKGSGQNLEGKMGEGSPQRSNRLLSFINRHTFDFQPTQGKFSKAVTVVGKTSVGASKVVKKGARLSHKVEKATNGEDATGMKFVEGEVGRKGGKVAGKVGKTAVKYTYKGGKKAVQFSYTVVKTSINKGVQVAKASATVAKRAIMVVVQTVTRAVISIGQLLAPFFLSILAGALALGFLLVLIGSAGATEQYCSTDHVFSDGTTEGNAQAVWTYLKGKGLSDEAVSGVMGNMERESNFDPALIEKGYPYQGHGLIQWSYGRKDNLLKQAALKGVSWTDLNFQLNFLWEESLSPESYYGKQLQREGFYENKSPSRCAYLFHKIVERSSDSYQSILNTRCKSAEKWYEKLKGTYKLTDSTGCASGSIKGDPNFANTDAWVTKNPYAQAGLYGQCTWFAWGRFYEIYGFSPGFTGNGYSCVAQLLATHPDKFEFSLMPKVGAVGSSDVAHNHVWIVVGVEGEKITIQEGNLNGKTDSFEVAKSDWHTVTYSLSQLRSIYGNISFANPK